VIAACQDAGIRIVVITGDHGLTARAIASQAGIAPDTAPIVTGQQIDSMSDTDLGNLRFLRDRLGDRFTAGIVLYTGQHTLQFGDRIAVVPMTALWQ